MTLLTAQVAALVTDIDDVHIDFSPGASTVLKIVIATILFGIALDIKITDFTAVVRRPFPIAVGIVAQFLLLPALTLLLTIVLDVRGSIALGMIEASGIGWQGRYEQAELVASYLAARTTNPAAAAALDRRVAGPRPDLSGGYRYLGLERMSYYVNKDAYRGAVRSEIDRLGQKPGATG